MHIHSCKSVPILAYHHQRDPNKTTMIPALEINPSLPLPKQYRLCYTTSKLLCCCATIINSVVFLFFFFFFSFIQINWLNFALVIPDAPLFKKEKQRKKRTEKISLTTYNLNYTSKDLYTSMTTNHQIVHSLSTLYFKFHTDKLADNVSFAFLNLRMGQLTQGISMYPCGCEWVNIFHQSNLSP